MPGPLVLSVNNRYTELLRASISYGKNGAGGNFLIEDGYFLNREGGNSIFGQYKDNCMIFLHF